LGGWWLVVLGFVTKKYKMGVFMGALDDLYGSSSRWHGQCIDAPKEMRRDALGHWVSEHLSALDAS